MRDDARLRLRPDQKRFADVMRKETASQLSITSNPTQDFLDRMIRKHSDTLDKAVRRKLTEFYGHEPSEEEIILFAESFELQAKDVETEVRSSGVLGEYSVGVNMTTEWRFVPRNWAGKDADW